MGKDSPFRVWAIAGIAVLVGIAGTTAWNQRAATHVPPPAAPPVAQVAAHVERPAPSEPPKPPDPGEKPRPDKDDPKRPEDDTPPLEDVVSQVSPAVVLVENAGARGTAFFVAPDTLLTNVHVIRGATSVTIRRNDGTTTTATVERQAPDYDVAVLRIANPMPSQATIKMISALNARAGREVIAIGSPLGVLQNTVTRGIVSAIRQSGRAMLIQTDAAVNPGNSGGPLLDRKGNAIGITTMGFTERQGLSFAIAIDHAQTLLSGHALPPTEAVSSTADNFEMLSPAQMSEHDEERLNGQRQLEGSLQRLARAADALDDYWRQFRAECYGGGITGAYDREWLAVLNPRGLPGSVASGCEGSFATIRQRAAAIRDAVLAADEQARRADVLPGSRRQLRDKYRFSAGLE
jgi:S1-C subfamily serine protease